MKPAIDTAFWRNFRLYRRHYAGLGSAHVHEQKWVQRCIHRPLFHGDMFRALFAGKSS